LLPYTEKTLEKVARGKKGGEAKKIGELLTGRDNPQGEKKKRSRGNMVVLEKGARHDQVPRTKGRKRLLTEASKGEARPSKRASWYDNHQTFIKVC